MTTRSFFRSLVAVLESEGFDVVGEASDGAGAFAAVERVHPDVVLLDVGLPDLSGFDIARALCDRVDAPAVVLTSSRDAADYGNRVEQSGARGFILKSRLSGAALLPYHLGRSVGYGLLGCVAGGAGALLGQMRGLGWIGAVLSSPPAARNTGALMRSASRFGDRDCKLSLPIHCSTQARVHRA